MMYIISHLYQEGILTSLNAVIIWQYGDCAVPWHYKFSYGKLGIWYCWIEDDSGNT